MPTKDNFAHFFVVKTSQFIVKLRHFIELFFTFFCHLIHLGRIWWYVYIHISPTHKTDMQLKKYITLLASALLLFACAKEEFDTHTSTPDGPVTVGFWVGRGDTRTETPNAGFEMDAPLGAETTRTHASSFDNSIGNGKLSISWSNGDQVAMWAKPQNGTDYTFSNQTFKNWFVSADSQNAYFTTTLDNAMPAKNENNRDITYNYYVCYPTPAEGTTNAFTIPSTQDGKMGGGADIMMAQGSGIALQSLDSDENFVVDHPDNYPSFTMKHLIHSLMFHVPAGNNWGFPADETIERIVFTMPSSATATGTVTANATAYSMNNDGTITTPALALQTAGSNTIALNLTDPIGPSSGNDLDFAAASIMPGTYKGDLTVKVYSQTKASQVTFSGINRAMAANRVTPVVLNCSTVTDRPKISFRIADNKLGEQPYKITLTSADTSTKWKDGDDHIYEYYTGSETSTIPTGSGFDLYSNEELLSTISGKIVTVTYESKSAIVTETITMPTITANGPNNISLNVPYLFSEDFSTINTYGFDVVTGAQGTEITGYDLSIANSSKENVNPGLRKGWTGARTGGNADGKSIRVGSRVDRVWGYTHTYGRLDSPALSGIKNGIKANVIVSFNYSGGRDGDSGYSPRAICGYTTTEGEINGKTGSFSSDADNWENIEGYTLIPSISTSGSFTNITQSMTYNINSCSNDYRLSWQIRGTGEGGFISNGNQWMFIDNIKVKIIP